MTRSHLTRPHLNLVSFAPATIRVVLAGAERYLSDSLVHAFEDSPLFTPISTGPAFGEVVREAYRGEANLVVVSHQHMLSLSGESMVFLQHSGLAIAFLLCDVPGGQEPPLGLLDAGFDAVCARSASPELIVKAGLSAVQGNKVLVGRKVRIVKAAPSLGERDVEIMRLVCAGARNSDIAEALYLAESTIKWHIGVLCDRFGVSSRVGLAMEAVRLGLVVP